MLRCKAIETLLDMDKRFKCENIGRGCQEKFDRKSIEVHETECIYRPIKCTGFVGSCESLVSFRELLDHVNHLETKPGRIIYSTFGTRFQKEFLHCLHTRKMVTFPLRKFVVSNVTFFNVCMLLNESFHHWIVLYGPSNEAKNYSYTLEYLNETDETKCSYTGKVLAIDETYNSIIENGNCFGINRKLFDKKFLIPEEDNKFKFFVTIRNMKEEVKDENVASGFSGIDEYLASIQLK